MAEINNFNAFHENMKKNYESKGDKTMINNNESKPNSPAPMKLDAAPLMQKIQTKETDMAKVTGKDAEFKALLNRMSGEIARALPKHLTAERMMRIIMTAYNSGLQQCSNMSIIAGVMLASQLGLEINSPLGHAFLIPRKRYGKYEANFQFGYRGELHLAHNTQLFKSVYAMPVYQNDIFNYCFGSNQFLEHKPSDNPIGEPIRYYGYYQLVNGGEGFVVMSKQQIINHAEQYSDAYKARHESKKNAWNISFDGMAMKTVLHAALKFAPKTIEFERQFAQDGVSKMEISEDMTEVPGTYDWDAEVENVQ